MFETLIAWLATVAVVLVGLVARALVAVLIISAIVLPMAALLYMWKGATALGDRVSGLKRLGHLLWRRGCYYTPGHLWLKPTGDTAVRVGVDDLAQRVLPDVASVHFLDRGTAVRVGDAFGRVECAGGGVTLKSPIDGTIRAINERLLRRPAMLHSDPYRRAWMVEIEPADDRFKNFACGEDAQQWLEVEDQRLTRFFEQQLGVAAADGGELILPPHKLLSPWQWEAIRVGFLDAERECMTLPGGDDY